MQLRGSFTPAAAERRGPPHLKYCTFDRKRYVYNIYRGDRSRFTVRACWVFCALSGFYFPYDTTYIPSTGGKIHDVYIYTVNWGENPRYTVFCFFVAVGLSVTEDPRKRENLCMFYLFFCLAVNFARKGTFFYVFIFVIFATWLVLFRDQRVYQVCIMCERLLSRGWRVFLCNYHCFCVAIGLSVTKDPRKRENLCMFFTCFFV